MTIQKIKSGRVTTVDADQYIGDIGTIFYNQELGDLRLSDGITVGGISLGGGGSYILPTASTIIKGGIKIGNNINITNGVISVADPFSGSYIDLTNKPDPEEQMAYAKRIDFISDNLLYKGEAIVGTLDSDPAWRIHKIIIGSDSDVTEIWASGNALYDKRWSDRLSYSYS